MSEFFIRLIRAQSVFEALKEDDFFGCRRVAEGDDSDFIFSLGVHDGNNDAAQEAEGHESLFLVTEAVVFVGEGCPFKHLLGIDEVRLLWTTTSSPVSPASQYSRRLSGIRFSYF